MILSKFLNKLYNKIKKLFKKSQTSQNLKEYKKINCDAVDTTVDNIINSSNTNVILNDTNDVNIIGFFKCKNYEICNVLLPNEWYKYKGSYLCYGCECLFGKWRGGKGILNKFNTIKCPICLEYKKGVSQPRCEHYLCVDCIKRCYYGEKKEEPIFPYSDEIKLEYQLDPQNKKWDTNYPLIKLYLKQNNEWCDERYIKYKNERYLRKCHLCRK